MRAARPCESGSGGKHGEEKKGRSGDPSFPRSGGGRAGATKYDSSRKAWVGRSKYLRPLLHLNFGDEVH